MKRALFALMSALLALPALEQSALAAPRDRIQLVVLITVDQMGAVYLDQYGEYLTRGIGRLQKRAAFFPQMRYEYANTETAPGHATITTGTWPSVHGMVANYWYDDAGKRISCVEGKAPHLLRAPGLADALALATQGKSRTVSVALKDRAAILLAGQSPRAAVWFDRPSGKFVASRWQPEQTDPKWMIAVNEERSPAKSFGVLWDRLRADLDYASIAGVDHQPDETDCAGLGRTFPRKLGQGLSEPSQVYYENYLATPHALESLMAMTKTAVVEEQLGKRGTIDLLAVGISTLDYAGHYYGPRSQEAFDTILRIDRAIGELHDHIEREVGAGSTLYVITADHGAALMPETAKLYGVKAERVDPRKIGQVIDRAIAAVDPKKPPVAKLLDLNPPRVYLTFTTPVADKRPYLRAVAAAMRKMPEVLDARPADEIGQMTAPYRALFESSSMASRDPDILFLQRPYDVIDYVAPDEPRGYGSGHGTPYLYDATVPVMIAGPGVARRVDPRPYAMTRLAPTIAALLGIQAPAMALDRPLPLENEP